MAGSQEFKANMQTASQPKGSGKPANRGTDNYKTQGSHLIGGGAYERQQKRDADGSDINKFAEMSRSATKNNGNFSIDSANKWANNARNQTNTNKNQELASNFSGNRVGKNADFAQKQAAAAQVGNTVFGMTTTNRYVDNARSQSQINTANATAFAQGRVQNYLNMNKQNQTTNVNALDKIIRQQPLVDKAYSDVQGLNTFGDMYKYGREGLPDFKLPEAPDPVKAPDFEKLANNAYDKIEDQKIGG